MSIATIGQAKYQYQDLICLELILRFLDSSVACFVEPTDGEDATLQVTLEGVHFSVEVQVKGAKSKAAAVDLSVLAAYLAHFPAHRSRDFLLERLTADIQRFVVMVCSQRAKDDCAVYAVLKDWHGEYHKDGSITLAAASELLRAVATAECDGVKGSLQRVAREEAIKKFASCASVADVRRSLQRLVLLDQWSEEDVRRSLEHRLRTDNGVMVDIVEDVLSRLLKCLVSSKASDTDVVPGLRQILSDAKSPSIAPRGYVQRGQEQIWWAALSNERVLLMSGPPRCGKSDAACWTAAHLQTLGFGANRTSSIEHAERILFDERSGSTVVVLDDPLGAMQKDDATVLRAYLHLEELVRSVPINLNRPGFRGGQLV